MTVKVNGRPKRMPCGQIGIERTIFDFAKGDPKARIFLLAMLRQFPGAVGGQADSDPDAPVSDIDAKAMADYLRRLGIKL